jgi:hypothetical protein
VSTIAITAPGFSEDLLRVTGGVSIPTGAKRDEWESAWALFIESEMLNESLARYLRDRGLTTPSLTLEGDDHLIG